MIRADVAAGGHSGGVPRLVVFRLGPVWVAAHLNDYGEVVDPRLGVTAEHARSRVLRRL